ncbi:MAG: hemerythrin domain-containing protein [Nitrospirota bacterium]|nr:hemerythrin domain-containing protein [Nitrospirota bacterium]
MSVDALQMLQQEHTEIRRQIAELEALFSGSGTDPEVVAEKTHTLLHTLALHERREEEVLFPAVPQAGPIQLVLQEHARLRTLLDKMRTTLSAARATPDAEHMGNLKLAVQEVAYCLSGHIMKEDQLAFRMAAGLLKPEQLADLGARMTDMS